MNRAKRISLVPYVARYFGEKVHIDQNEKLVHYGVTHNCCVDGYSGKIVDFATMAVKNNIEIYEHVFRYLYCYENTHFCNSLLAIVF